MSGMWKRSHGRTSEAPPDERGGYRYVRPTATAPHLDSTQWRRSGQGAGGPLSGVHRTIPMPLQQGSGCPHATFAQVLSIGEAGTTSAITGGAPCRRMGCIREYI